MRRGTASLGRSALQQSLRRGHFLVARRISEDRTLHQALTVELLVCALSGAASSTIVFHSAQPSHFPAHLLETVPQFWQTKVFCGLAMVNPVSLYFSHIH